MVTEETEWQAVGLKLFHKPQLCEFLLITKESSPEQVNIEFGKVIGLVCLVADCDLQVDGLL